MIGQPAALERDDLAILRDAPLLAEVPTVTIDALFARAKLRFCASREVLIKPDQPADCVYLVLRGKVQVYRGRSSGKHAVLSILLPGAALGLEASVDNGRYAATAEAIGACKLLEIPAHEFSTLLAESADLAAGAVRVLTENLGQAFQQLERIQLKPTSQRLADFLLCLVPDSTDTAELVLPYEKALIASYLGMEPESLSRALKDLQGLGVANRGRRVWIDDISRLRGFAEMSPAGNRAA